MTTYPCVATRTGPTWTLRWYRGGIGVDRNQVVTSVRLAGVRHHLPYASDVPWDAAQLAWRAWDMMLAERWDDVRALATHRWAWHWLSLRRELVAIPSGSLLG